MASVLSNSKICGKKWKRMRLVKVWKIFLILTRFNFFGLMLREEDKRKAHVHEFGLS